ncbi:MAG TPA: hypothetical protein VKQ52_07410, partial [Puia sp.]|nr:hypothetical protein [Puia sp.]
MLTQHNDLQRTGWNAQEKTLNTKNVKPGTFGKLYTYTVDDEVFAQPLVVTGLTIGGGTHDVVYICTVNNTIYAFDADSARSAGPY